MQGNARARLGPLVAGALLAVLALPSPTAGGAEPASTAPVAAVPEQVRSAALTSDGTDRYDYRHVPGPAPADLVAPDASRDLLGTVAVAAPPGNRGVNLRAVWWFDGADASVDGVSCVTWAEYSGPIVQAGVALRVREVSGRTQAVTVTNNIMWGARNSWNVHLWNGGPTGELIGQSVLRRPFGESLVDQPPLPWRLCARVVGSVLQFKAWSLATQPTEPDWTDPGFGTSFTLPRGWVYPGRSGWYAGHLRGGDATSFRALRSERLRMGALDRLAVHGQASADAILRNAVRAFVRGTDPTSR